MKYIIMGLFSLLAVTTQAQVRGIVKDNTGEPVPGANVFWVNTGQGVTTKEDGSFSISKPSKSHMLVISFIGFQNDTIHVSKKNQELAVWQDCSLHIRYVWGRGRAERSECSQPQNGNDEVAEQRDERRHDKQCRIEQGCLL